MHHSAISTSLVGAIYARAEGTIVRNNSYRNFHTMACTKNSIFSSNIAAIKMTAPLTTAKGGVKDRKFASESFVVSDNMQKLQRLLLQNIMARIYLMN